MDFPLASVQLVTLCRLTERAVEVGPSNHWWERSNLRDLVFSDVDECELNTDGCDNMCTNTVGSFECSCRSGFQLSPNGRTCLGRWEDRPALKQHTSSSSFTSPPSLPPSLPDTDECVVDMGGCSQACSNNPPGSFSCVCRSGFTLASDGVSCTDVNECETDENNCLGLCINTDGGFMCGCELGFTLDDDGVSCNGKASYSKQRLAS